MAVAAACSPEDSGSWSGAVGAPSTHCEIYGDGVMPAGDAMTGYVRGDAAGLGGSWTHTGAGQVVTGAPDWILCRINGDRLGDFGGPATVDGASGYAFSVGVRDVDGTPGGAPSVTVETVSATRTYRPSGWEDGTLATDGGVTVTIPSSIDVTAGNAGSGWAWITMTRAGSLDRVVCRYRGGAGTPNPRTADELAGGASYHLDRCTGEAEGTAQVDAGDHVDVVSLVLHVHSGAHSIPGRSDARTSVSVDLEVLRPAPVRRDHYHIVVWNEATLAIVLDREDDIASGNLTVRPLP